MNEHEFTPGPWVARKSKWGDLCIHAPTIEQQTGLDYVIVQDVGGDSTDHPKYGTPDANARLIAAAPSMYDFVRRAAEAGDGVAKTILEAIHGRA